MTYTDTIKLTPPLPAFDYARHLGIPFRMNTLALMMYRAQHNKPGIVVHGHSSIALVR